MAGMLETKDRQGAAGGRAGVPLAISALVLGLLGILTSFLLVGGVLALVGVILGWAHLRRRQESRGLAWCGVGLSALGLVASVGFLGLYLYVVPRMAERTMGGGSSEWESWVGKMAPEVEVTTLDGGRLRLSELRGRRVVLDFWATWCPPCVKGIPHFIALQEELGTNAVVVVGLSDEDPAVLRPFAEAHGIPYPLASVAEVEVPPPFSEVRAIPTTFFLDRNGRIQHVAVGYHDLDALREQATGEDLPLEVGVEAVGEVIVEGDEGLEVRP
jgi:peroxiredoxin